MAQSTQTSPIPSQDHSARLGPAIVRGSMLVAAFTLAGCASMFGAVGQTADLVLAQHRADMPTPQQVTANSYYQIYVRTPTGHAVLVLGNLDGDREAWYGKGDVVVFLRHGLVVKTTGLPHNLAGLRQPDDNPFARGLQHLDAPLSYTMQMDWSPGYRYDVPVAVRLVPRGNTQLTILGVSHDVKIVEAQLDAPAAHWHAASRYWVDAASGLVWKSEQQISPQESITIVQLKPYRKALP